MYSVSWLAVYYDNRLCAKPAGSVAEVYYRWKELQGHLIHDYKLFPNNEFLEYGIVYFSLCLWLS